MCQSRRHVRAAECCGEVPGGCRGRRDWRGRRPAGGVPLGGGAGAGARSPGSSAAGGCGPRCCRDPRPVAPGAASRSRGGCMHGRYGFSRQRHFYPVADRVNGVGPGCGGPGDRRGRQDHVGARTGPRSERRAPAARCDAAIAASTGHAEDRAREARGGSAAPCVPTGPACPRQGLAYQRFGTSLVRRGSALRRARLRAITVVIGRKLSIRFRAGHPAAPSPGRDPSPP